MPLARRVFATAVASIAPSRSMVPTTRERASGSATYGVAYSDFSAHVYSRVLESVVRATLHSRPPWLLIQSVCSAIRNSVASDGVLYVWFLVELSIAVARSRNAGIHRPDAVISSRNAGGMNARNI